MSMFAYSGVLEEGALLSPGFNAIGAVNRGGNRAHGGDEEQGDCRELHSEVLGIR